MTIPLFDPASQYRAVRREVDEAILEVLSSGHYILGDNVAALEEEIAADMGVDHAVGVASGTDALVISLMAVGVGPGDEVVVPSFSFFATAEAVMRVGAQPVFADVLDATGCIDPVAAAARVTRATRAIIPVHLYGLPADMAAIGEVANAHGLKVVEDNAQAFGASFGGRRTGGIGDAGCMSFFPTKTLGGFGDGGMISTPVADVAASAKMLRAHGSREKNRSEVAGFNSRLDEVQAAALRVKLRHARTWHERRRQIAAEYAERLSETRAVLPCEPEGAEHTYGLYVIRVQDRDSVRARIEQRGVSTGVYYPQPLPYAEAFRDEHGPGDFPVAEQLSAEVLAIPLFAEMSDAQVDEVASAVESALS